MYEAQDKSDYQVIVDKLQHRMHKYINKGSEYVVKSYCTITAVTSVPGDIENCPLFPGMFLNMFIVVF